MVSSSDEPVPKMLKGMEITMRMRKKKNGEARIKACMEYLITNPLQLEEYRNRFPIELEIGCGKGGFICEMAVQNPDRFFFAVELCTDALITALERAKRDEIPNLRFINLNANNLCEYFHKGDVEVIYLNFSDPWPKSGHKKRRLTYRSFLEIYRSILTEDGKLCFKTDNRPLFDFSLEEFSESGWKLDSVTNDLHRSEFNSTNIMTEYEKNFSEKGIPINRLVAYPPKDGKTDYFSSEKML